MNGRFRRAEPARAPKARVVVVTEGMVTEAGYLKRFDRLHGTRSAKLVIIPLGADPRAVVERAIKEKKRADGDLDAEQDSFWAVFDRDEHARFSEAINLARGKRHQDRDFRSVCRAMGHPALRAAERTL